MSVNVIQSAAWQAEAKVIAAQESRRYGGLAELWMGIWIANRAPKNRAASEYGMQPLCKNNDQDMVAAGQGRGVLTLEVVSRSGTSRNPRT